METANRIRILAFGDIFGRPGREALALILPRWKEKFSPDLVMTNGENLSHGKGISETTVRQLLDAGVNVITGGNHSLEGKDADRLLDDESLPLLRPLNFIPSHPGRGTLEMSARDCRVLVLNAIAQSHMRQHYDSPYPAIEAVLARDNLPRVRIMDWHAETTSEKRMLGWWLDGRVSLVFGTHSHVPTADEQILPGGTGFISDVGMTGAYHSIIGEAIEPRISILVAQQRVKPDVAAGPPYEVNAILADIDAETGKTIELKRLREILAE